jgi:hypothetical protein
LRLFPQTIQVMGKSSSKSMKTQVEFKSLIYTLMELLHQAAAVWSPGIRASEMEFSQNNRHLYCGKPKNNKNPEMGWMLLRIMEVFISWNSHRVSGRLQLGTLFKVLLCPVPHAPCSGYNGIIGYNTWWTILILHSITFKFQQINKHGLMHSTSAGVQEGLQDSKDLPLPYERKVVWRNQKWTENMWIKGSITSLDFKTRGGHSLLIHTWLLVRFCQISNFLPFILWIFRIHRKTLVWIHMSFKYVT